MKPTLIAAGLALLAGLATGLFYARAISPVEYFDASPGNLTAPAQAGYVRLVARAYVVDGDAARARQRLAWLGPAGAPQAVASLAQQAAAAGEPAGTSAALGALARALGAVPAATPLAGGSPAPLPSLTPRPTQAPTATRLPTITPQQLPTRTPTATPPGAFSFVGRQPICDPDLETPLIQVVTEGADGQPVPGVEVWVTWDAGLDHFFTGLKPEMGLGYADFAMTPGVEYTVHLAESPSASVPGLVVTDCTGSSGEVFPGSWRLSFRAGPTLP